MNSWYISVHNEAISCIWILLNIFA